VSIRAVPEPRDESPERDQEHNSRGFFIAGPQMVNPSDLLAKMIGYTHCHENGRAERSNVATAGCYGYHLPRGLPAQ
jgi:hypothetical protein